MTLPTATRVVTGLTCAKSDLYLSRTIMPLAKRKPGRPARPTQAVKPDSDDSGDDIQAALSRQTLTPGKTVSFSTFAPEDEEELPIKDVAPSALTPQVSQPAVNGSAKGKAETNAPEPEPEAAFDDDDNSFGDIPYQKPVVSTADPVASSARASDKADKGKGKAKANAAQDVETDDDEVADFVADLDRAAAGKDEVAKDVNEAAEPDDEAAENDEDSDQNGAANEDGEYEVEEILHHGYDEDDEEIKYLVHWLYWDDPDDYTWEPEGNLTHCRLILDTYKENNALADDEEQGPAVADMGGPSAAPLASPKKRGASWESLRSKKRGQAQKAVTTKSYVYTMGNRSDEAREVKGTRLGGTSTAQFANLSKQTRSTGKRGRPKREDRADTPPAKGRGKGLDRPDVDISTTVTTKDSAKYNDIVDKRMSDKSRRDKLSKIIANWKRENKAKKKGKM